MMWWGSVGVVPPLAFFIALTQNSSAVNVFTQEDMAATVNGFTRLARSFEMTTECTCGDNNADDFASNT